jgi:hypothetical protein
MILLETAKKKEKIIMIAYIHEKKERRKPGTVLVIHF